MKEKSDPATTSESRLPRVLTGFDATALAVGIVIGTGIFAVPGFVARELASPGAILLVWSAGGLLALAGALTYAECAALFPQQGGSLLYVLHAWGPFAAFFKGWGSFLVGYPGSSAGIATILGIYAAELTGLGEGAVRPFAAAAVTLVWILNLRGTRFSGSLQTALTLLKVGAIALLAILALSAGTGNWGRLLPSGPTVFPPAGAFAAALVGVLWTFDGWQNLTVITGEVVDPAKRITRALLLTVGTVTGVYLLLNVAYLVILPLEELQATDSAASSAARAILGPVGGRLLAAIVVVSAFGALFGIAMAGPRYFFAMGEQGLFFRVATRIDPETSAPRWAATMLFAVSLLYVLTGTFEQIMGYYVAVSLIYNALSIAAIYRLRRKFPDRPRPFRVPGYPVTPALVIAGALWVTGNEIAGSPVRSGIGILVLLSSAPAYLWWKRGHVK